MRDKVDKIILAISLLALLAAGILTVHFGTYAITPPAPADQTDLPSTGEMPPPWLPRISAPRAILVLDVSGSMGLISRSSDPDRIQTVATLQFFDIYLKIMQEILDEDDEARLAVVLFGTVAQTIEWDDGGLFLPVTEENRSRFRDVIVHYLGAPRGFPGDDLPDPRRSQDSDYSAALIAVDELVDDLASPPAVLFMTDGKMVIHPCFTPLLGQGLRNGLRGCRGGVDVPSRLSTADLPPIFNRRDGERPINKVDVPEDLDHEGGVIQRVRQLLARRFPDPGRGLSALDRQAPLAWFPLLLDIRDRVEDQREVSRLLDCEDTSRLHWDLPEGIALCLDAGDMVRQFVVSLCRWLRMFELPLVPGETRFRVPSGTRIIIVQVESDRPVQAMRLVKDGREIDLTGRGRFWGGVVTGDCDGPWAVVPSGEARANSTVFFGLRHDWALTAPAVCAEDTESRNPEAHLSICRIEDGAPVPAASVYGELPSLLPGSIRSSEGPPLALEFRRVNADDSDRGQAYVAEIPVARIPEGPARLTIQLGALREVGIPLQCEELGREITIESRTRIVIQDHKGRQADRIRLENVPRAPDWVRALRENGP